MVYFWQKQNRRSNRHSSPKVAISPLLSAATTAADTVLAAVVAAKSDKKLFHETINDIASPETIVSPTDADEAIRVHRGSSEGSDYNGVGCGGGVGGEGGGVGRSGEVGVDNSPTNNIRGRLASPRCRGNSNVMTNKIQSLVLDKLSEYARRKQESNRRRVAERELDSLNLKIDKLLSKMDDGDLYGQAKLLQEEECVVCLAAPATMKTFPCGHRVVCRKCLIKTMQVAISQRCLPLRCVICRNRILSLQHSQDTERNNAFCLADEGSSKYHNNSQSSDMVGTSHGVRLNRSNATPVVCNSTPFKSSIFVTSSPVSQVFVPCQNQVQISGMYMPDTSQSVASNGTFHRFHSVAPVHLQVSHPSFLSPPKKTSIKPVIRLLGNK